MGTEGATSESTRLAGFARFFKQYVSVSSIVTAALPIPVTAFGLIPTYRFQTKVLSTYTSLFCFLLLAFLFYSRHKLARIMFPESYRVIRTRPLSSIVVKLLPLLLITASGVSVFMYHRALTTSIVDKRANWRLPSSELLDSQILEGTDMSQTPEAPVLMLYYLGIFITAESALVVMAMKEYLQDLLEFSETDLVRGTIRAMRRRAKKKAD